MPTRRTILTSLAAGAGVFAVGAAGAQAMADPSASADAREVDVVAGDTANVKSLQYLLTAYGFKTTVDGDYGTVTEKSVKAYQGANDLVKDGEAGPLTMKSMLSGDKAAAAADADKNSIKAAQQQLVKQGYKMAVDGDYGSLTTSSVEKYQTKHKLSKTGNVDYITWTFLFNPPTEPGSGLRKGPAVLVAQSGTGLNTWMADCGPSVFVSLQLRLGQTPGKWTDVANRGDAINYARRTVLGMTDDSRGTGQIKDEVGLTDGFHSVEVGKAKTGGFDAALTAVRDGGVSMLGGDLAVAAKWNGRETGSVLHWVGLIDYKDGKYQVTEPSSKSNKLVWVTKDQLASFASTWGDSVCIK